jgi:hypothetical protein
LRPRDRPRKLGSGPNRPRPATRAGATDRPISTPRSGTEAAMGDKAPKDKQKQKKIADNKKTTKGAAKSEKK